MKKLFKTCAILFSTTLLLASCSNANTVEAVAIGTINGKELVMPYYNMVMGISPEESTENNETSAQAKEETSDASAENEEEKVEYSLDSATLVTVMGDVLKETGHAKTDTKKLNIAMSNLKAQYGNDYLKEAEKQYQLPIKNDKDLIRILKFSIMYSGYLDANAGITDAKISEEYYKTHAVKYCSTHILVENKNDADKLQKDLNDGKKSWDDLEKEAREIMKKDAEKNGQEYSEQATVSMNDGKINGVTVKQFADLGCQSSNSYVPSYKDALEGMDANTISKTPVKSEFGYHIIKLDEIEKQTLEKDLQEEIKNSLLQAKQAEPGFQGHFLTKIIDEVQIEITDKKVKEAWDKYVDSLKEDAKKFKDETSSTTNNETSSTNQKEAADKPKNNKNN